MKEPSFYCENCGREVSSGLESCPGCGQKFYSVLCPSCGFTGDSKLFGENCPNCGYVGSVKPSIEIKINQKKQIPSWIYKLIIIILAVVLFVLLRIYFLL